MAIATIAAMLGRTTFLAVAAPLLAVPAFAQSAKALISFDIDAGPLDRALAAYAQQAGAQLIYTPDVTASRTVHAIKGSYSAAAALQHLLRGSDIEVRQISDGIIMLKSRPAELPARTGADAASITQLSEAEGEGRDIVVTGSHIRGASPAGTPSRTLGSRDMARNGYASVAQALAALPGNFGGMATEQSALSFSDRSGTNTTLASGVNLRGLGPEATLVLVNGRRIAGAGLLGDFADISSIPMAAVDRVEVVTDGASAIYGSDAVAGVVNIILKGNFKGLESNVRLGSVTKGSARDIQLSQTAGTQWATGSALLSYEYNRRTRLASKSRDFARSADSRAFGGTDHRYPYSMPGNILGFDPATGSLEPAFAIPAGQDGTSLDPSNFVAGAVNLENFRIGTDLSPGQTRHSLFGTATQEITDTITASLEARFAHRKFDSRVPGYATILSVTPGNPWFVSPTTSDNDLIGYAFTGELGATRTRGSAQSLGLTGALDVELGAGWKATTYAAYARQRDKSRNENLANEYLLAEALGTVPDDPATPYSPSVDGYFNPYGTGASNPQHVLDAIRGYTSNITRSTIVTGDIAADGPLMSLPAGPVRMAIGTDFRRERFNSGSIDYFFAPVPTPGTPAAYARSVWAGYAELAIPLFGPANARPGIARLDLSAAIRVEHYGDFGSTTNPKLSARWDPMSGLSLRTSWGTSFRAPNLRELRQPGAVNATVLQTATGRSAVVLQRSGGNASLDPERARSWTAGIDVAPKALRGLKVGLTLFRTVFDRRIDLPALRNFSRALTDPSLASFVRFVSPATNAQDQAFVEAVLASGAGGAGNYPIDTIAAVVDARYVNTGKIDVAGADLDISLGFERGADRFTFGASGTYLDRWREQLTPTSAAIDRRNEPGRPIDLRGRLTAGWARGPFDMLLAMNYVDSYRDLAAKRIQAWTTFDLRVAYAQPSGSGALSGLTVALIAQNLFDRAPPFYDSSAGAGYDGANADATGRFLALQIAKRW